MTIKSAVTAVVLVVVMTAIVAATTLVSHGGAAGVTSTALPQGSDPVTMNPADFTTTIDNPYLPLRPGTRWIYRETDPDGTRQRVVVTVTNRTKRIANGITARVVTDVVTERGRGVVVTDDWYAHDRAGDVWYLSEHTTEYENGKPKTTRGSFEAGVKGAQAGVALPAAMQGFGLHHAALPLRGNAGIAQDFLELSFAMESGRAMRAFSRWPCTLRNWSSARSLAKRRMRSFNSSCE